jgi:hypothetical protein
MKQYVTFGQNHRHEINGKVFDRNCVATYDAPDMDEGRKMAFDLFGRKFCFHYSDEEPNMSYFPRGFVEVG